MPKLEKLTALEKLLGMPTPKPAEIGLLKEGILVNGRSLTIDKDGNQRLAQASTTQDSSVVPSTPEPASGTVGSIVTEDNARNSPVKGQNQHPSTDGDQSGKKKNSTYIHGKVRGTGAVSKVRAPLAPGWTGAGFDVDGRG
ncbi:UNVERIFIED_CONTAM: hypothetical protein Scaly_0845200 [Sesamum calycinum]|uniref:Uncharacterized protein n=1 Tax=Sesamum calycinum TaxID=2727403 RepID=A0AAW2QWI2_9LAMI